MFSHHVIVDTLVWSDLRPLATMCVKDANECAGRIRDSSCERNVNLGMWVQ